MEYKQKEIDFAVFVIIPALVLTFFAPDELDVLTITYVCFMIGLYSLVLNKCRNERVRKN